jgi:hypothetical protein
MGNLRSLIEQKLKIAEDKVRIQYPNPKEVIDVKKVVENNIDLMYKDIQEAILKLSENNCREFKIYYYTFTDVDGTNFGVIGYNNVEDCLALGEVNRRIHINTPKTLREYLGAVFSTRGHAEYCEANGEMVYYVFEYLSQKFREEGLKVENSLDKINVIKKSKDTYKVIEIKIKL